MNIFGKSFFGSRRSVYNLGNIAQLFVGRQRELAIIEGWFEKDSRPVFVIGPRGSGKTSLLYMYAHQNQDRYAKQIFVSGSQFDSLIAVLPYIASQLGLGRKNKRSRSDFEQIDPMGLLTALANGKLSQDRNLIILDDLDEFSQSEWSLLTALLQAIFRNPSRTCWIFSSSFNPSHFFNDVVRTAVNLDEILSRTLVLHGLTVTEIDYLLERLGKYSATDLQRLRNMASHQLGGNPHALHLLGSLLQTGLSPEESFSRLSLDVSEDLTSVLLVPTLKGFKAVPAVLLSSQQVVTPSSIVLPTAPYIIIPIVRSFWQQQLEEFEELLNDENAPESEYQSFFERNPHFLKNLDYSRVIPHPILKRTEEESPLIPDFFLQPLGSKFADILDLKLPTTKVIVGKKNRRRFSVDVHEAIAQVREYRDYFEDTNKRRLVEQKYGLTAYRPTVSVVIGRSPEITEEKLKQITDAAPKNFKIITYDQLLAKMRRLVETYSV